MKQDKQLETLKILPIQQLIQMTIVFRTTKLFPNIIKLITENKIVMTMERIPIQFNKLVGGSSIDGPGSLGFGSI